MSAPSVFAAVKWSTAAELASTIAQPLVFLILARILTPADFGIMAAALMVISFSQIFWEGGMAKSLIQRQTNVDEAANAAFWVNIGLALIIASVLFAVAPSVAKMVFHDERVSPVLQVMTLQILLSSLTSVQTALLQKALEFGRIFWLRLSTVILPGIVSIPLALHGFSYWALVGGTLAGQVAQVILLWRIRKWRPRFTFDRAVALDLIKFGRWVVLSGMLTWFWIWADSLVVGMYMGSHDLGIYRIGNQFVSMAFGLAFVPLLPVIYSYMSQIQDDRVVIRNTMLRVAQFVAPLSLSLGLFFAVDGKLFETALFGSEWLGLGQVIAILGLGQGLAWTVGFNGEVYRAINKPEYETYVMAVSSAVNLLVYLIAISYGLETFLWAKLALVFPSIFLQQFVCARVLGIGFGISWLRIAQGAAIGGCGALAATLFNYIPLGIPNFIALMMKACVTSLVILAAWYIVDKAAVRGFTRYAIASWR